MRTFSQDHLLSDTARVFWVTIAIATMLNGCQSHSQLNQYPFFENHSLKISYVYGERYLDKAIEDACTKLVSLDIMMTDDYTAMFPEGTQNVDLPSKIQKLEEEVKRILIPYQEGIIVAGMGG